MSYGLAYTIGFHPWEDAAADPDHIYLIDRPKAATPEWSGSVS